MTQTTLYLASSPELYLCPLCVTSKLWFAVFIYFSCKAGGMVCSQLFKQPHELQNC